MEVTLHWREKQITDGLTEYKNKKKGFTPLSVCYNSFVHNIEPQKPCLFVVMSRCIILIITLHYPNPSICCSLASETTEVSPLKGTRVEQRVVGQLIRFDHRTERHTCSDQPHCSCSFYSFILLHALRLRTHLNTSRFQQCVFTTHR